MKLKKFIKQLKNIEKKGGNSMKVRMADNILVVKPTVSFDKHGSKCVVITDQK